jgi:hypothetical protein
MNQKLFTLSLFIAAAILFNACKKDDSDKNDSSSLNPGQSQISCTVSGGATSSFTSNLLMSTATRSSDLMNISGGALNGTNAEIVMIILPRTVVTGTYTSADMDNGMFAIAYSNGSMGWGNDKSETFNLVVSKVTATEVEGTFNGKIISDDYPVVQISNGKFAAKFPE